MKKELARKTLILSDEQKADLFNQYYNSEKPTTELIKEFGLDGLRPAQITYLFDDFETTIECEYCGALMKHEPPTRTKKVKDLYCPNCGHIDYIDHSYENCYCLGCKNKRSEYLKKYIALDRDRPKHTLNELSIWNKLILGALIQYCKEDNGYIYGGGYNYRLYDNLSLEEDDEIFDKLVKNHFLVLSSINTVDNFRFSSESKDIEIDYDLGNHAFYELWLNEKDLEILNTGRIFQSTQETVSAWRKINESEVHNFILKIVDNLSCKDGFFEEWVDDNTLSEIVWITGVLVKRFSLLQIMNLVRYLAEPYSFEYLISNNYGKDTCGEFLQALSHFLMLGSNNIEIKYEIEDFHFALTTKYFYEIVLKNKKAYEMVADDIK